MTASRPALLPLGVAANVTAVALLGVATLQTRRQELLADQLGWLSVAIAGLLVALTADLAVLLAARRRLAGTRATLRAGAEQQHLAAPAQGAGAVDRDVVTVEGGTLWHRASCPLVAGKASAVVDRDGPLAQGQRPCGICRP